MNRWIIAFDDVDIAIVEGGAGFVERLVVDAHLLYLADTNKRGVKNKTLRHWSWRPA